MKNINELKACKNCQLPEPYETIEFDNKGICNICESKKYKDEEINWNKRKKQLDAIIEDNRNKYAYDCIIPFSGGKDSTFAAYYLMKEYKIKPLIVRFNHGFVRQTVQENKDKVLKK